MEPPTVNSHDIDNASYLHAEITAVVREKIGLTEHLAALFAEAILCGLRERMGGREVYLPAPDRSKRNAEIRRMFNGRNMDEVCKAFAVSRDTVYRACR